MNELSIVIPCVSSVEILPKFIDNLSIPLMSNPSEIDIIVVANEKVDSVEDFISYVRNKYPWIKFKVLQRKGNPRRYGALARFGTAYSTSRYVVFVSPYGENDISLILPMLNRIKSGFQVIQATRYSSKEDAKRVPLRFRFYQSIYRTLTRAFLGKKISDSTYGFKMFDRIFVQSMGLTQNGYSISPEITFKTILTGGSVEYVPSTVKTIPVNSDFRLYEEGFKYLWLLFRGCLHRFGLLWF